MVRIFLCWHLQIRNSEKECCWYFVQISVLKLNDEPVLCFIAIYYVDEKSVWDHKFYVLSFVIYVCWCTQLKLFSSYYMKQYQESWWYLISYYVNLIYKHFYILAMAVDICNKKLDLFFCFIQQIFVLQIKSNVESVTSLELYVLYVRLWVILWNHFVRSDSIHLHPLKTCGIIPLLI